LIISWRSRSAMSSLTGAGWLSTTPGGVRFLAASAAHEPAPITNTNATTIAFLRTGYLPRGRGTAYTPPAATRCCAAAASHEPSRRPGGSAATSAPSICHPRKARPEPTVAGPPTAADPVGGLGSLLSGDRRHERVPGCRVARSGAGAGTLTSGQAPRK